MAQAGQKRLLREVVASAQRLRMEFSDRDDATADTLAQAAACAAPILAAAGKFAESAIPWLMEQLEPWEQIALEQAAVLSTHYQVPSTEYDATLPLSHSPSPPLCPSHIYDAFLHRYARGSRKQHGVFFTPPAITDYIIRQIDTTLRDDFGLPKGLAQSKIQNRKSKILLLDPACGTGVFQLAILDFLHARRSQDWNDFVPDLLPRLTGIEFLPAAALLAKLNIALKLAETGYNFAQACRIQIHCGNALDPTLQFAICNSQFAIPILLGNPPFSSLSTNTNDWIAGLVRGDDQTRGYVRAGEQRLGERKTWLHDDYVKFIRLAQWHVEQAGSGVVGLVTNRGYIDNTTFRLMRQELLRVFPRIQILDLHGSRKAHEIAPDGGPDENVFGLDQGVAIGIFSRPRTPTRSVEYSELWGTREAKLAALANGRSESTTIVPSAPGFRFTQTPHAASHPEYDSAWSLTDAMPLNASAPVTARDHFVVAFTAEELRERIAEFRDLAIPDDVIRTRYFQRTRSARYEKGDTRGWKLAAARATVAADADWQHKIVRCLYRPFDWRFVFWHPAMIDWPRMEVTRHLVGSGFGVQGSGRAECGMRIADCELNAASTNGPQRFGSVPSTQYSVPSTQPKVGLSPPRSIRNHQSPIPNPKSPPEPRTLNPEPTQFCLIARRQQLPTQPCTFFWIADCLALDGVIRSDNRGSESLFPLYVRDESGWRANFAAEFIAEVVRATQSNWLPLGRGDLERSFGPEDLLAYVYALFHAPTYRERYAAALRTAFPRVLMPHNGESFRRLVIAGHELIDLHLLRHAAPTADAEQPDVQSFRAGGYVALQKWLQPPHRSADDPQYGQIAAAIARTLELMRLIDGELPNASG